MLTMELTTWDGRSCRLPTLLNWSLTYTGGVPCDSMTACCPYDASMAELLPGVTRFTALRDGAVMLRGVVDAYEVSLSGQGLLVTLEGRGMAALLMDNESEALTYGTATLEMHKDAIKPGQRVVIIDDLIATGGTTEAIVKMVEREGGKVVKIGFVMELAGLKGRDKLNGYDVDSLIIYEGA